MAELSAEDRATLRSHARYYPGENVIAGFVEALIDRHVTAAVTQALNDAADDAEQIGRVSPPNSEWRDVPPWLRARAT